MHHKTGSLFVEEDDDWQEIAFLLEPPLFFWLDKILVSVDIRQDPRVLIEWDTPASDLR